MAATGSSGSTTATTKYNLDNYLEWDSFRYIVQDRAEQYEIWKYVNPDETGPDEPTKPQRPAMTQDNAASHKVLGIEYEHDLRLYERKMDALRGLRSWMKESIHSSCVIYIKKAKTTREILKALSDAYQQTEAERIADIEREYVRLRMPPRRQSLSTWLSDWRQLYKRADDEGLDLLTRLPAVIEFIRATKSISPEFAIALNLQVTQQNLKGEEVPSIPDLIQSLTHHLRLTGTIDPQGTAFATLQGIDTDKLADDKKSGKAPKQQKQEKQQKQKEDWNKECICGKKHSLSNCYYLIPSIRPDGWRPYGETALKVTDALNTNKELRMEVEKILEGMKDTISQELVEPEEQEVRTNF
jgi:hypothetical protein